SGDPVTTGPEFSCPPARSELSASSDFFVSAGNVYRGRRVPGVYQRCTDQCDQNRCDRHRWQYTVELPSGPGGARRQHAKGGFATARQALAARTHVLRETKAGGPVADPNLTVGRWLPTWLAARYERGEIRDGTAENYRDNIDRFLIPRLGHIRLVDLRPPHLSAAYDAIRRERAAQIVAAEAINEQRRAAAAVTNTVRRSGRPRVPKLVPVPRPLGPQTMRRIHNTLSGALRTATRAGLILRNPAPDADLPKLTRSKTTVWTAQQLGRFLDAIEPQRLYPLYHLAAFAGLRRGELCGLGWDDVDLDVGRITVRWQITQRSYVTARKAEQEGRPGRYRTKPKTLAGEDRVVDLDAATVYVLRQWRRTQLLERLEWGPAYAGPIDDHGDLVFTREDGRPLDPGMTYQTFVQLVRQAGLSHLKLHGLRHVNISLQLEAGVSETVIAMRVGHTSPALIRSTYGHLIGTVGQRAAEATAALVPRRPRGSS
ncbi:tyrosine-type recombinase/integrase, partial [Phytohabitans aurantiacus]|uniref:tyrosine-type recombinase/integrase n=1 Tax=Phytohabitans aurantiacus TaxID=3016789 RepID=UPI002490C735